MYLSRPAIDIDCAGYNNVSAINDTTVTNCSCISTSFVQWHATPCANVLPSKLQAELYRPSNLRHNVQNQINVAVYGHGHKAIPFIKRPTNGSQVKRWVSCACESNVPQRPATWKACTAHWHRIYYTYRVFLYFCNSQSMLGWMISEFLRTIAKRHYAYPSNRL